MIKVRKSGPTKRPYRSWMLGKSNHKPQNSTQNIGNSSHIHCLARMTHTNSSPCHTEYNTIKIKPAHKAGFMEYTARKDAHALPQDTKIAPYTMIRRDMPLILYRIKDTMLKTLGCHISEKRKRPELNAKVPISTAVHFTGAAAIRGCR